MNIQEYVRDFYDNRSDWFVEEVGTLYNQQRIMNVISNKEYLSGQHKILERMIETYNGKDFYPRKIILQYAKTILNFSISYLLSKPITLTGNEDIVKKIKNVYNKGKYNRIDFDILDRIVKYGNVYEYVYLDENKQIKSKLINAEDSYPVFNYENKMIAFIEYYNVDSIDYYTVYYENEVEKYDNYGGDLRFISRYNNLSGLPILYKNQNEMDENVGRSDLEDIVNILDNMEDLISKFTDGFYKFMNPIPVAIGQQLKGNGLPTNIIGGGLTLDDGSDFKLVSNGLDYQSFESIYKTLLQALLDISNTPAVSMNKTDISNLSEVSIKLLFSLADVKGGLNEKYIREGLEQRFNKIRQLLEIKGIAFKDEDYDTLDVVFQYARPTNEKDIIDNLKVLSDMKAISLESILEHSPYTTDVRMEMDRIKGSESVTV